jgi:hypothetical protein
LFSIAFLGHGAFIQEKKRKGFLHKLSDAASCRGQCLTPSEAIHVVPKKHTKDKANMGNPTEFILVENAFLILVFTL